MTTINEIAALPGYTVGGAYQLDGETLVVTISGPGFSNLMAKVNIVDGAGSDADEQAALDSIANPATQTERAFQHSNPAAALARDELETNGYAVTRPTLTADVFTIAGGTTNLTGQTPADLITQAGQLTSLS